MIDDRTLTFPVENQELIQRICQRRFGVGADGVILLRDHGTLDFRMVYFNADGKEGSMCGNGGRCAVAFAIHLGLAGEQIVFEAVDGIHEAVLVDSDNIRLKMQDVKEIKVEKEYFLLDTGSPHYVKFVDDLDELDVLMEGRSVRYNEEFEDIGVNVNFVQSSKKELYIRTYERGVEDETLSCGTGAVAAAICAAAKGNFEKSLYRIRTRGGKLGVFFKTSGKDGFRDVYLEGSATYVFKGSIHAEV
jgi:diaminopimelate epimerase